MTSLVNIITDANSGCEYALTNVNVTIREQGLLSHQVTATGSWDRCSIFCTVCNDTSTTGSRVKSQVQSPVKDLICVNGSCETQIHAGRKEIKST